MNVGAVEPEDENVGEAGGRTPLTETFSTEQRLLFLTEINEILSSSTQEEEMLASLASFMVPRFADWCVVHLRRETGLLHPIAIVGRDGPSPRSQRDVPEELLPEPILQALRSGGATLEQRVDPESWGALASDETQREIIAGFGPRSSIVVAINARGRTIGIISFIYADSGRYYTEDDLALALDVTQRAALAADNARLFQEANRRAQRTEELASVAQAFSEATLDLEQLYDVISRRIAELIGDLCVIRLLDETGGALNPVAVYHPDPETREFARKLIDGQSLNTDEGLSALVLRTGQTVRIPGSGGMAEDYRSLVPPALLPYHDRYGGSAVMLTPLIIRGR
ncbi:MAG TPA: GAF domain-containing protein, partial [Thermomicrobiaceae bacterium]|nr:GAF domain-containing protein [Thermomicrobiaceae bacterium]